MTWHTLASINDIPPNSARECIAAGNVIALYNVAGRFYALDGLCPHQGGPLGKGALTGCIVTCPWHGFQFDVTTGQHQTSKSLVHPSFPVRIVGDEVQVDLAE